MKKSMFLMVLVLVMIAGCGDSDLVSGGSGLVETDEVVVSAETSGKVTTLYIAEGDQVLAGDTLAVIDPSRTELELKSARAGRLVAVANLETARLGVRLAEQSRSYVGTEFDRITRLVASGTATQRQLDAAEFEHLQALLGTETARTKVAMIEAEITRIDAEIALLKRRLEDSYPTTFASGTVVEKYVDPGELLISGKSIAKVARLDTVWVKVYLAAPEFAEVVLGDKALVDTESGGKTYDGTVVWTSEEAEFTPKNVQTSQARADLVYAIKVRIPNIDGKLKIGMPVYVTLAEQ